MSLKLTIGSTTMSFLAKPATLGSVTINGVQYSMTLVDIRFNKQMYQPGEIFARIQFTGSTSKPTLAQLTSQFKNNAVSLKDNQDIDIAQNYYVYDLIPEYTSDSLYVNFQIFSADKTLTLERTNCAYTAKRLGNDILSTKADEITLPHDDKKKLSSLLVIHPRNELFRTVAKKKGTGSSTEDFYDDYIQPYLVQYDESFYDMLIRTANRWGEFVFFEDGKLYFGRDDIAAKAISQISNVYSFTNTCVDASQQSQQDIVTNDEYLEYIKEDDYLHPAGDLFAMDAVYGHKIAQSILNMKGNVFDWMVDKGVSTLFRASHNKVYLDSKNKEYDTTYFSEPLTDSDLTDFTKARVKTQYGDVCFKQTEALQEAIQEVKDNATSGKTYKDYLDTEGKVVIPDGASEKLTKALKKLEDAMEASTKIAEAEEKVNKNAESGKTYKDYLDDDGKVSKDAISSATGKLKTALEDLEKVYEKYSDKRIHIYAPFSTLGALDDDDKNLSALSSNVYPAVLKNEMKASEQTLCIDLGANFKEVKLGSIITINADHYIVTRIEGVVEETSYVETTKSKDKIPGLNEAVVVSAELKQSKSMRYRVYAVKQVNATTEPTPRFYPPVIPSGHVRFSGPQIATIASTFDPKLNSRYRIKYKWQSDTDEEFSPWLPVAHEMMSKQSGSMWQLEKDTEVLVDYKGGNVERPYIVGAIQTDAQHAPRHSYFNTMNLATPGFHAIRLTDGYGGGADTFAANMLPIGTFIKGFCPEYQTDKNNEDAKFYEGGVEITDRYGIYSIVASTDERNISIKSPYGDVNLNAFTGITISAPNGDVKIVGKNVSIEAGNKLTLESGKNIRDTLLGKYFGSGLSSKTAIGASLVDAGINKLAGLVDLSLFRHVLEVFLRPVDGTLELKSNRYMLLEAGKGDATIKSDRYSTAPATANTQYMSLVNAINIINSNVDDVLNTIQSKQEAMNAAAAAYGLEKAKLNPSVLAGSCPADGVAIETEVYNNGATLQKNYTIDNVKANTQKAPHYVEALLRAANDCSTKAHEFYTYIDDHVKDTAAALLNKDTIPTTANGGARGRYNDAVIAKAADGLGVAGAILKPADFAPGANVDFSAKKKEIKRAWLRAVMNGIVPGGGAHADDKFPYALGNNAAADPWVTYVKNLSENINPSVPWGKVLKDPFVQDLSQMRDAYDDLHRWAAGKNGQIILSDQPTRSVAFDPDGTPKMYENEIKENADSGLNVIKQLLHDWD